eukprot:TRINITY_DN12207_c0_g1_i2.p1 TRINITY_DN12207_c0_g1~~TRINITY_DN12207_c0_g1_i2.p1  ORF type:complete len:167 (+),score=2.65 TRINITY_DN12207_c0_g1_i2:121-621(+)
MGFWGLQRPFFYQLFIWLMLFFPIISFYILKLEEVHPIEVFTMAIITFSRCVNIGSKYSTLGNERITRLRTLVLTLEERMQADRFMGWLNQTKDLVLRELRKSMIRHEVDRSSWLITFMVNPSENISKHLKVVSKNAQGQNVYDCHSILEYLIDLHIPIYLSLIHI